MEPANDQIKIMNKFLTEILEQPEALKKTLMYYTDGQGKNTLKELKGIFDRKSSEQIIFTGMGSSNYTSMAASTLFNTLGIPAFFVNTSELLHYNLGLLKKPTTLICFSQSGESYEIREILKKIPEGTFIYNIEGQPGDGGKYVRASGGYAKVLGRTEKKVIITFRSSKRRPFFK